MLNLLDNEGFDVAVPKGEGAKNYQWNEEGGEEVLCVVTSNNPIVYCTSTGIDDMETKAWYERFGTVLQFNQRLPNADKRFKRWGRCTHCYAHWILGIPKGGLEEQALPPTNSAGSSASSSQFVPPTRLASSQQEGREPSTPRASRRQEDLAARSRTPKGEVEVDFF